VIYRLARFRFWIQLSEYAVFTKENDIESTHIKIYGLRSILASKQWFRINSYPELSILPRYVDNGSRIQGSVVRINDTIMEVNNSRDG